MTSELKLSRVVEQMRNKKNIVIIVPGIGQF